MKLYNNQRVLFFINTVTSYQDNFYKALSRTMNIKVIVLSKKYSNYKFKIVGKNYIFLDDIISPKKKITQVISNFKPKSIIFGGYRLKYSYYINKIIKENNIKSYYWLERLDRSKKLKLFLNEVLLKKILKKATGILAIGNEAKKFYKKFNNNIINLPYSIKFINKIAKPKINKKKIKFLFVGQLIKRKSIEIIINLLNTKNFLNFQMTFVGEGTYKNEILKLSRKNNNIKYFRFQNNNKLKTIYQKNDVLIFLSKFDGWGVVALEAMNYKLAIISSKNVGSKEIFCKDNFIIEPKANELEKKIDYIIKNYKKIRDLGNKNRKLLKFSLCNSNNSVKKFIEFTK